MLRVLTAADRHLRRFDVWPAIAALLAFGVLTVAAADGPAVLSLTLAGLLIALLVWQLRDSLAGRLRSAQSVGTCVAARLLLAASVVVLTLQHGSYDGLVGWTAMVAAVLLSVGLLITPLDQALVPTVAGLPGVTVTTGPRFGYDVLVLVSLVALGIGVVAGAVAPGLLWVFEVAVLGWAVLGVLALLDLLRRLRSRSEANRQLPEALSALQPLFALHWSGPEQAAYQVSMWLPYLERIGAPYVVVVRSRENFDDIRALTDRPLVLREKMKELDAVMVPSLKAVFYVNTALLNNHLIHHTSRLHIQLNHGDSDKVASSNPVLRIYDRNYVAGQAAIDRFEQNGVPTQPDFFRVVGRPQLDGLQIGAADPADHPPTVLYAPTWSGFYQESDYSSLPWGAGLVGRLAERGCRVIFRPHPYTNRSARTAAMAQAVREALAVDAQRTGRRHLYGEEVERDMSIVDCFNASDAMVSDVSSVVSDYLQTEKPFAMVAVHREPTAFVQRFPMARAAYVLRAGADGMDDLDEVLDELLVSDSRATERHAVKSYYLGEDHPGGPAQRFVDCAREDLGISASITE